MIIGLIKGDRHSYLRQDPDWTPTYGPNDSFTTVDLLQRRRCRRDPLTTR